MFDLFSLMSQAYETPGERKERILRETVEDEDVIAWDPQMTFRDALHIDASTYKQPSLFKVKASSEADPNKHRSKKKTLVISDGGNWCYRELILDAGDMLFTMSGSRRGVVRFDGPVIIPAIHSMGRNGEWGGIPWMSLTPMEFFTLRPGTKMATGHTVIAGLGMGYQLEQVCKKRSVKKVTLVERDQEIVDWILPRLDLNDKDVDIIVGDAVGILPELEADVTLVDIYKDYGYNGDEFQRLLGPKSGKVWHWGSAKTG